MRAVAVRVPESSQRAGRALRIGASCLLGIAAVACGNSTPATPDPVASARGSASPTPTPKPTATPAPTPPPTPIALPATPPPAGQSFFAPLVVQIENSAPARPQSGLSRADVVYEYETEGGITRFSAIFLKPPDTEVGPVRSARLATIALIKTWRAVLLFSGASDYVSAALNVSGQPIYNETSAAGDLFRVGSRFAPHNLYTDGGHMADLMARVKAGPTPTALWIRTAPPALNPAGAPAGRFTVPISNYEQPVFTWHPEVGGYMRDEPTGRLIDAGTGQSLAPPTVVVMQMPIAEGPNIEDAFGTHGLDHALNGSGPAQIFMGGAEYDATWVQPEHGVPQLQLAGGLLAPIAPGTVWFCLVRPGSPAIIG
jgi:hypothetical protein